MYIHLTNASIQTKNPDGPTEDNPVLTAANEAEAGGSKVSLKYLWRRLEERGIDSAKVWAEIEALVVKTLVAVEDDIPSNPSAFEVFGFDVLIDDDLRAWLIEINASPSLARGSPLDATIKEAMIADTIKLVDPLPFDRQLLLEAAQNRLNALRGRSVGKDKLGMDSEPLDVTLGKILRGRRPRLYGEMPQHLGGWKRIAPREPGYEKALVAKGKLVRRVQPLPVKS